jgi:type IV secretory pathway VirB4 component
VLPSNNTPVVVNRADRKYHAYITGQTGTGKSTLLHNLIHHDIQSGQGVGVIDPHGSLIQKVLKTSIDTNRLDDVVYLRCADAAYPVPLNPFRTPPDVKAEAIFNTVLWMLKSIYKASWSESRMETVIRNILQVVLSDPEATPLDIQELVSNHNYRRRVLKTADNKLSSSSKNFWRPF